MLEQFLIIAKSMSEHDHQIKEIMNKVYYWES